MTKVEDRLHSHVDLVEESSHRASSDESSEENTPKSKSRTFQLQTKSKDKTHKSDSDDEGFTMLSLLVFCGLAFCDCYMHILVASPT